MSDLSLPLVLAILAVLIIFAYTKSHSKSSAHASPDAVTPKEKLSKQDIKQREFGEWIPQDFPYPSVTASSAPPTELKPIPYRPFRWGAYHVTMGIRDMPFDEWIELDNQFPSYYNIRKHRIATRGHNVVRVLPDRPGVVKSASHAAVELVHDLCEYLSRRHPTTFTVARDEEGGVREVTIVPVGATLKVPPPLTRNGVLKLREVSVEEAEQAMRVAALLVQDDLALMVEGTDGRYYFQGGAICVPGFWRMRDKIGMSLEEIHIEGHVPQYETKLRNSMDRFFKRMPVEKPVIRNNYFFQVVPPMESRRNTGTSAKNVDPLIENDDLVDPDELSWSITTNGSEETFTQGHPIHPDEQPVVAPENLRLRTERQTLRRLPLSGAILFTIRTYLFPVTELAKEPGVPARMASAVRSWTEDVKRYKGNGLYEQVMLEYLDKCAEEQRLAGIEPEVKNNDKFPY